MSRTIGPSATVTVAVVLSVVILGVMGLVRPSSPPPTWALAALNDRDLDPLAVEAIAGAGDIRYAWPLIDRLRFDQRRTSAPVLEAALTILTGVHPADEQVGWVAFTDHLLRRDTAAPSGYLDMKREIFLALGDPDWSPFFMPASVLDWRTVTWGGVGRDGIVALDDPQILQADEADWLTPNDTVFGVAINGAARAYPRRLLVVHELVNDALGGRRIALPYCTLCGAAIPYLTDDVGDLRTSGLLQRSNKLMYDVQTESLLDQFLGVGLTGPLRGVSLERVNVTVTSWGEWRRAHPGTTTLQRPPIPDRNLSDDPYVGDFLNGRDTSGPIFAVGDRDARLEPQVEVLGVEAPNGVAIAFVVTQARAALEAGQAVAAGGVRLALDAGGLVASPDPVGPVLPTHEAFWFAWSQFRPDTAVWAGVGSIN